MLRLWQHLDALELAYMVNCWADKMHGSLLWGDKDTFAMGMALAGKAHMFSQVAVPPGESGGWAVRGSVGCVG